MTRTLALARLRSILPVLLFAVIVVASLLWSQATPSIAPDRDQRGIVSLREYMDIRFDALEAKFTASDAARQLAIDKAEQSVNTRLEGMNEFRSQLKDQGQTFATKEEVNKRAETVDMRVRAIEDQLHDLNGSLRVFGIIWVAVQAALGIWLARAIKPRSSVKP